MFDVSTVGRLFLNRNCSSPYETKSSDSQSRDSSSTFCPHYNFQSILHIPQILQDKQTRGENLKKNPAKTQHYIVCYFISECP